MHNLLSLPERKLRRRQYQTRRAVVGLVLLSCVLSLTALSLVPALLEVRAERSVLEREAEVLENLLQGDGVQEPREALRETTLVRDQLARLIDERRFSDTVRTLLRVRPEGVTVRSLMIERAQHTAVLEGVAARRDTLVAYSRALEAVPEVANAVLPISDLAKSTDLEWRMTLTLATSSAEAPPTP